MIQVELADAIDLVHAERFYCKDQPMAVARLCSGCGTGTQLMSWARRSRAQTIYCPPPSAKALRCVSEEQEMTQL